MKRANGWRRRPLNSPLFLLLLPLFRLLCLHGPTSKLARFFGARFLRPVNIFTATCLSCQLACLQAQTLGPPAPAIRLDKP